MRREGRQAKEKKWGLWHCMIIMFTTRTHRMTIITNISYIFMRGEEMEIFHFLSVIVACTFRSNSCCVTQSDFDLEFIEASSYFGGNYFSGYLIEKWLPHNFSRIRLLMRIMLMIMFATGVFAWVALFWTPNWKNCSHHVLEVNKTFWDQRKGLQHGTWGRFRQKRTGLWYNYHSQWK